MVIRKFLIFGVFLFLFVSPLEAEELVSVKDQKSQEVLPSSLALPSSITENPHVRILIGKSLEHFQLEIPFPYSISIAPSLQLIEEHDDLPSVSISVGAKGIQIGKTLYDSSHLKIETNHHHFKVDGREYYDDLHIILSGDGKINLINEVNLEDYLKGVLPLEVSDKWNMEALKAQAVTARTYAYYKMLERSGQMHILTADVLGQVYKGKTAEKARTNQAIQETTGEILITKSIFQESVFPAFFHASCGGETTNADFVWRIRPNAVLTGVKCPFCKTSKYDSWQSDVSLDEIESKIRARKFTISPISNIIFSDYDPSGRARKVSIIHSKGTLSLDANDFRIFVGPEIIRSTKTSIKIKEGRAYFEGKGWGHGVGFCQWGAKGQADAGKNYKEIVLFYYPGSKIKKVYGVTLAGAEGKPSKDEVLFDKVDRALNEWFG